MTMLDRTQDGYNNDKRRISSKREAQSSSCFFILFLQTFSSINKCPNSLTHTEHQLKYGLLVAYKPMNIRAKLEVRLVPKSDGLSAKHTHTLRTNNY